MPETATEDLDLVADLGELRALGPWLSSFLAEAGAEAAAGALELALHEVCVNVVTHAYNGGAGLLHVKASSTPETIDLVVQDSGAPFDASEVTEPVPGVPQIHGYGLMIVRKLVDELSYTREEGMNTWLLRTRR